MIYVYRQSDAALVSHLLICTCGVLVVIVVFIIYWEFSDTFQGGGGGGGHSHP